MSERFFDDLARTLASTMPRRRALRLTGAAIVAAAVPGLRPRSALGQSPCGPDTPCSSLCQTINPKGACGIAIKNACGQELCHTGYAGCIRPDQVCCNTSGPEPWYCEKGEVCGAKPRQCCPPKYQCGDNCCKSGQYCERISLGSDYCADICPPTVPNTEGHDRCIGVCCTKNETCGFFGCTCKSGYVSQGNGTCTEPKNDPGDPKPGWNPFRDLWNMMGQSNATHGGSRYLIVGDRTNSRSSAVDAALQALAAVNAQGAAAMLSIRYGKPDPAIVQRVTVSPATPPTLSAGSELDAASAAALNKLLVAEARAHALIGAMAKALWRTRAAHAGNNQAAARDQLRSSAAFAAQAVSALGRVQALRTGAAAALTGGGVSEVLSSEAGVAAFIAAVRSRGLARALGTPLRKLGVDSADLKRLSTFVLQQPVASAVGPVLIAPLHDPARAADLKSLITELSKYSTRARRHPIANWRG
jgi:hypothetical protein